MRESGENAHAVTDGPLWANLRGVCVRLRDGLVVSPLPEQAEEPSVSPQLLLDRQNRLLLIRNGYVATVTATGCPSQMAGW